MYRLLVVSLAVSIVAGYFLPIREGWRDRASIPARSNIYSPEGNSLWAHNYDPSLGLHLRASHDSDSLLSKRALTTTSASREPAAEHPLGSTSTTESSSQGPLPAPRANLPVPPPSAQPASNSQVGTTQRAPQTHTYPPTPYQPSSSGPSSASGSGSGASRNPPGLPPPSQQASGSRVGATQRQGGQPQSNISYAGPQGGQPAQSIGLPPGARPGTPPSRQGSTSSLNNDGFVNIDPSRPPSRQSSTSSLDSNDGFVPVGR